MGVFEIDRGRSAAARALARLLGCPRAGRNVHGELRVRAIAQREIWDRWFGRDHIRSVQWIERQRLVESFRGADFTFDVCADQRGMLFQPLGMQLFRIPVPASLELRIDAGVTGSDDGWEVQVAVAAPKLGVICSYTGEISQVT